MSQINSTLGRRAIGTAFDAIREQNSLGQTNPTFEQSRDDLANDLQRMLVELGRYLDSFPDGSADRSVLAAQADTIALGEAAFLAMRRAETSPGIESLDSAATEAGDAAIASLLAAAPDSFASLEGVQQFLSVASGVAAIRARIAILVENGALGEVGLNARMQAIATRVDTAIEEAEGFFADVTTVMRGEPEITKSGESNMVPRTEFGRVEILFELENPYTESDYAETFSASYQEVFAADGTVTSGLDAALARIEAEIAGGLDRSIQDYARYITRDFFELGLGTVSEDLTRLLDIDRQVAGDTGEALTARPFEVATLLIGGLGDDTLEGMTRSSVLRGGAGNDTLIGGGRRDTLDGGMGDDVMRGGARADTYIVDSPGDVIDETDEEQDDIVLASIDFAVGDATVLDVRGLGTEGLKLTGSERRERITGTPGDDTIDGGGGRDTLTGGDGSDTFLFEAAPRRAVIEDFTSGEDSLMFNAALLGLPGGADGPITLTQDMKRDLFERGIADYDPRSGDIFIDYEGDDQGLSRAVSVGRDSDLNFSDITLF